MRGSVFVTGPFADGCVGGGALRNWGALGGACGSAAAVVHRNVAAREVWCGTPGGGRTRSAADRWSAHAPLHSARARAVQLPVRHAWREQSGTRSPTHRRPFGMSGQRHMTTSSSKW
eukprot:gene22249-biopygen17708